MAKWADYVIVAVRFDTGVSHIDKVQVRQDNGEDLGPTQEASRMEIIAAIKKGTTFVTAFKGNDGKLQKGQPVNIIEIKTEYIKTSENKRDVDNLDNLPLF